MIIKKKTFCPIILYLLFYIVPVYSQQTTSVPPTYWENYMSFKIGNYFEYEVNGGLLRYSRRFIDTVTQTNEKRYFKIEYRYPLNANPSYDYERIDSSGNWYRYFSAYGDCFLYRLNIPLNTSYMWRCSSVNSMTLLDTFDLGSILGNAGPFLARLYHLNALAQQDEYIARKFQLYYWYSYEGGNYANLVGAIIDSIAYGSISGTPITNSEIPTEFRLYQNYPNPFNPTTEIKFFIPKRVYIKLIVLDVTGKKIKTLHEGYIQTGEHKIKFDGYNLASGIYFYRLQSNNYSKTMKTILIK